MTAREGLNRILEVWAQLGPPESWPRVHRVYTARGEIMPEAYEPLPDGCGCILQRAAGVAIGHTSALGLNGKGLGPSLVSLMGAYDRREPVLLGAALEELETAIETDEEVDRLKELIRAPVAQRDVPL